MDWSTLSIFLSGIFILGIMSWLYKETIFYRVIEHIYVGTAIGYSLVMGVTNVQNYAIIPLTKSDYTVLIPIILGLLFYLQLSKQYRYLARYAIAITIGTSLGIAVGGFVEVQIMGQIASTASLFVTGSGLDLINNVLLGIFVILGILVFFMTKEPKGSLQKPWKATVTSGRLVLMAFFGAVLANNIMSRLSLIAGIMQKLLFEWLPNFLHLF
jgi:hypothetical protein